MTGSDARVQVLRRHGADGGTLDELLEYTEPRFMAPGTRDGRYPIPDEPFVEVWREYAEDARRIGTIPALRSRLVQLRFPIGEGMSKDPAYCAATRRGAPPPEETTGLELARPEGVELSIHPTPAGHVPVIVVPERADFVALVRALTRRNEPVPVPDAQGACIVGGYNNWDRIARMRAAWEASHPDSAAGGWPSEFSRLQPRRELYQDRFILLSAGPYSGVAGEDLGLTEYEWKRLSIEIRKEHECAHYVTRRLLGSMSNSLHDELIADYVGLTLATGRYRPMWFLRFMGLESYPRFRRGGRLESYRGDPPLSDEAFQVLQRLLRSATLGLARIDPLGGRRNPDPQAVAEAISDLAGLSVEELAFQGSIGTPPVSCGQDHSLAAAKV